MTCSLLRGHRSGLLNKNHSDGIDSVVVRLRVLVSLFGLRVVARHKLELSWESRCHDVSNGPKCYNMSKISCLSGVSELSDFLGVKGVLDVGDGQIPNFCDQPVSLEQVSLVPTALYR